MARRITTPLAVSRLADQAVLGLASLLLARELGPEAFASVAILLTVNSLAIQISDLGLGFAVYRARPGTMISTASLARVRQIGAGLALAGVAGALVIGGSVGVVVLFAGALWPLTAEAYVRKACGLKLGATSQVVTAEVVAAAVFGAGVVAILVSGVSGLWVGVPLIAKHVVEIVLVRDWRSMFASAAEPARAGAEWIGQMMTFLVANVDYVLVGVLLGAEALSIYVIAFRIASVIPAFMATPITQAAFLEFAAAPAEGRQGTYRSFLSQTSKLGTAGALPLIAVAPLVPLFLGDSWSSTAPVLALLAVAVPWRLLLGTSVAMALTAGAARPLVAWEFGRLTVTAAAVWLGSFGGLSSAAAAVGAATVGSIGAVHLWACSVREVAAPRWLRLATASCAAALVLVAFFVAG